MLLKEKMFKASWSDGDSVDNVTIEIPIYTYNSPIYNGEPLYEIEDFNLMITYHWPCSTEIYFFKTSQ